MDPTAHCLNCWKSMEGTCFDFRVLQEGLFSEGKEIEERIDYYRLLSGEKGCCQDPEIFGRG